jgi:membrane protease YdiL (CAAX protease family)
LLGEVQVYCEGVPDDLTPVSEPTTGTAPPFLPSPAVRWGWWDVLYGLLAFVLSLVVSVVVVVLLHIDINDVDAVGLFGFLSASVTYAAFTAVVVVAARRKGLGSLAADFGLRFRPVDIAIGLGIGVGVKILAVVLAAFTVTLTDHTPAGGNFELSPSLLWVILNGVVIATLLGPIVEELFFRGLVLRAAYNRVLRGGGSVTRAATLGVLVSALGFALLHLYESSDPTLLMILGGSTFALGAVNSWITLRTGRLGAAIIAHVFFNGSSVLLLLLTR